MRVIYVMTHDSIGLGEDGPTHQPVEHLAALRAIPNLLVLRPADAVETLGCWQLALETRTGPSILALQPAEPAGAAHRVREGKPSAKGAYVIAGDEQRRRGDLRHRLGSRSSRVDAREAAGEQRASRAAVVSVPSLGAVRRADRCLPRRGHRRRRRAVAVEAGDRLRLGALLGRQGRLRRHALASAPAAPAEELYKHFGITAEAVVEAAKAAVVRAR